MPTTRKLISEVVLGSDTASVTLSSIPSAFTDLLLFCSVRSTVNNQATTVGVTFNSAGTTNLTSRSMYGWSTTVAGASNSNFTSYGIPASQAGAGLFGTAEIYIPNYASSAIRKSATLTAGFAGASASFNSNGFAVANWADTSAITEIVCTTTGGSFLTGSTFYLYGITKA